MNVLTTRAIRNHCGFALIAFLLVLVSGASFVLLRGLNAAATQSYRDEQTARALAEAKAALIGYAASHAISGPCNPSGNSCRRPGDLPCPDINNDGEYKVPSEGNCDNQLSRRVGRLPWKTLGLPDLRDGSGERLWYAVSSNFRVNSRTICDDPSQPGCLNSDSRGTITVRNADGSITHDGSVNDPYIKSGAVAVIIAPGAVLQRQESANPQDRGCTLGVDCGPPDMEICKSSPPTDTPRCNRVNYLDRGSVGGVTEDNENFGDSSPMNGFIQGDVRDADGNQIVNDKILPVTYDDIMPVLERRVVGEVSNCLREYAGLLENTGRYPWAARPDEADIDKPDFKEDSDVRLGRLPETPFAQAPTWGMDPSWGSNCKLSSNNWWLNWKEHVFYALAEAHQPSGTPPCPAGTCLTVDPPYPNADNQVVVILAGKPLQDIDNTTYDQDRSDLAKKLDVKNYLELENANTPLPPDYDDLFSAEGDGIKPFNDIVCMDGICL